MILELKLAFFQATQLEFVVQGVLAQQVDNRVQIAMFYFQLDDASLYLFGWDHGLVDECGD